MRLTFISKCGHQAVHRVACGVEEAQSFSDLMPYTLYAVAQSRDIEIKCGN